MKDIGQPVMYQGSQEFGQYLKSGLRTIRKADQGIQHQTAIEWAGGRAQRRASLAKHARF
jgi:hypothetical protein